MSTRSASSATLDVIGEARARGAAVLVSTHLRELAIQACSTALVLRGGSAVARLDARELAGEEGAGCLPRSPGLRPASVGHR